MSLTQKTIIEDEAVSQKHSDKSGPHKSQQDDQRETASATGDKAQGVSGAAVEGGSSTNVLVNFSAHD